MYRIAKLYSKARNIPIRKWAEDIKWNFTRKNIWMSVSISIGGQHD
jgi:hypothetical protein